MTRTPHDDFPFERRRVSGFTRAAFVLLWLAAALVGAVMAPAPSPAEPSPRPAAAEGDAGRLARQTPEDPEPGGGPGDEDDGEEDDEGEDGDVEPTPVKPVEPDSTIKRPAATLPSGAAPMETLGVTRPPVGAARPGATPPPPPQERGTILGLHPALFFAALLVGHVFIVRAVTD
ncbi:MAG TPA: hypothetical protein VLT84_12225 [Acidobacteriota bacterium]|nr:hypothetical protein [Acidobacteriota bacterium]